MTDLTVADVRLALHALRHAWYEDCGPERPFLFSAVALEAADPGRTLTMAEFGCVFDYAQHIKRHQRLTPRGVTRAGSTGPSTAPGPAAVTGSS
jgi:hypothetical protein